MLWLALLKVDNAEARDAASRRSDGVDVDLDERGRGVDILDLLERDMAAGRIGLGGGA